MTTKTDYEMVVGLEVHCQLATRTKLFCACGTDGFGETANTRVCPVCTGQPGTLPVLNKRAVELAFQAALALDCRLAEESVFARKNYFYPDLPKAYQISQYERPFSTDGGLDVALKDGRVKRVRIHRVHLEEDAGKLLHEIGSKRLDYSLVDFNRGGAPLIEIVSEPDLRSSEEAYAYLTALKEVLQHAGCSRCDMEKGEMRCDANVSLRARGRGELGTRAELKNLNSFKGVKDALEYEFRRQAALLDSGRRVVQETRLWDAQRQETRSMRSKEEAHDYRYFPDPDLAPLRAAPEWVAALKASLPELPAAKRQRFQSQHALSAYDASVLASDRELAEYFERALSGLPGGAKTLANLVINELLGKLNAEKMTAGRCPVPAESLGELARLVQAGTLSSKGAKDVLARMWESGKPAAVLVAELGVSQVSDDAQLRDWIEQALRAQPQAAADLKSGKERAIGSLVGVVMKLSKGKANPARVNVLIKEAVSR
ncbi:MAG: Asp-tRNA(Asn)/Glu-tRNA(Gln) amidotransferase subunit GatB [Elusimicrobia bacterium]|nr:Asp-tRNA(Asn)/Glu-tRNA(Gln) amidotransferase subunit GatB [Elusimicrobiota bacterium]MDE2237368.1 Asp-tRNA(Asn)/Glu-tRNA(Gln) amidotransferase subunit GatB [Elusimicrobiota bacterium]MDE2426855.1 Asp-tRNA(Asn)/Glu-tRNA(Gln) amidotransferase subunit GatB [Elusimicrobiota bacterium]